MAERVDTTHALYDKLSPKWTKTRVLYQGEDEVHAAGEALLPKLKQQDEDMYNAYKTRTRFLPAVRRTAQGLQGTVTRKEPIILEDGIEELTPNVDGSGCTLLQYYKIVLKELIILGVCGTLVDHVTRTESLTVAQAEEMNVRPVLGFYKAESIINWKYDMVDNLRVLVMVVLKEVVTEWVNEFETKEVTRYRVLRLDIEEGVYTQQLHEEVDGKVTMSEVVTPLKDNEPLNHIPFYFHGEYENPPLYDLVTTNIKHYQLKADHNHALHYIGLPTPIFPGVDPNDPEKPTAIGPEQIVYLSNPQAKPFYLTYSGEGLASIEHELTALKEDMAYLGANMLAPQAVVSETATKATIRRASETSTLGVLAEGESSTLTSAIQELAIWYGVEEEGIDDKIGIELSNDFDPTNLTSQDLLALVQSWQSGAFSKETLHKNLQRGEIIDGDVDVTEEQELIDKEMPEGEPRPGFTEEEE